MKNFEDLFKEIEENQEIKKSWQEAREEQKKMNANITSEESPDTDTFFNDLANLYKNS